MDKLLELCDLEIDINTHNGIVRAVRGVSLTLGPKETLAIVGESGSGKTMTVKGIMQLLPQNGIISGGKVILEGKCISDLSNREMKNIRGSDISMIFQDPMTSLNPTMTIGNQIIEVLNEHTKMSKSEMKARAIQLLELVGISNPDKRINQYPHQLSGGMRQRIVIAIALACNPKILIADEPTTALDVTIQAQILDLMRSLQETINTSIIIITHNLGVVANIADRVGVMYGGKIVETGYVDDIFYDPKHPYTQGLMTSIPNIENDKDELATIPGTPPDLINPPSGCPFAARCKYAMEVCLCAMPEFTTITPSHFAACWLEDPRAKAARNTNTGNRSDLI